MAVQLVADRGAIAIGWAPRNERAAGPILQRL